MGAHIDCIVAAINLTPLDTYKYPQEVKWTIDQNTKKDYSQLAISVSSDVNITGVIVQHEYGIFGGQEGENVLHFMRRCSKPMLVTLHTVLPSPSAKMRIVTEEIIRLCSGIVVLTSSSKQIIESLYPESLGKVFEIPHGIHPTSFSNSKEYKQKLELENHIVLSTFGLLSPGKGIEYVVKSLPEVVKKHPSLLYLILGETHPVIRRQQGEQYRIRLLKIIAKYSLKKHVKFYDQYLSLKDLFAFLKATDIYISTSTNPNQAVSGTLSYALGTGRPVISTEFAQSKEIVTSDMGRLVPIKDSPAMTRALLDMLSDNRRLQKMSRTAYHNTRTMVWSNVAQQYIELLTQTIIPPFKIDYLKKLTDDFGLLQFAALTTPNTAFGYTLDDNARAVIVCSLLAEKKQTAELHALIKLYFNFIKKCQQPNGIFINYLDYENKSPTAQNSLEDLEDAQSRAFWALCELARNQSNDPTIRKESTDMVLQIVRRGMHFTHCRSKAYAIKGMALVLGILPEIQSELEKGISLYADDLMHSLKQNATESWYWYEDTLLYNNGVLPESLLIAGEVLHDAAYTESALLSLQFLSSKTFSPLLYRPIGHSQWYKKNGKRSQYDQQPEDPASMICALERAYRITHQEEFKTLAKKCFSWFLGNNSLRKSLYDEKSGGCYDGLHPDRVNLNQGAESLVSYLLSSFLIGGLQ